MSFPIPYQRLRFRGFGKYNPAQQQSGVDAAQTLQGDASPKNVFRLIISCLITFALTGGSVATFTVDLRDKDGVSGLNLVNRATLTATQVFSPPMGDAGVDPAEFQGYPIPWYPDNYFNLYAATPGAGESTIIAVQAVYLEWEILKE